MAEGSVTYKVKVDDTQAQAELNRLQTKIRSLEDTLAKQGRKKGFLEGQLSDIKAQYDAAVGAGTDDARTEALAHQYDKIASSIQNVNQQMELTKVELDAAKQKAGQLSQALVDTGKAGQEGGEAAASGFEKLEKRIVGLVKRVFIFSIITKALRTLKTWLGNTMKTNQEMATAMAQLKGALYELAAPILNVVIPAFTFLVRVATAVIRAISSLINTLFGRTASEATAAAQALYDEQNALDGVGGAAKDAAKSLANFDEIQKLTDESAGGGGGGGGGDSIAPDFGFDDSWIASLRDKFAPELEHLRGVIDGVYDAIIKLGSGDIIGALSSLGSAVNSFGGLAGDVFSRVGAASGTFGSRVAGNVGKLIDNLQKRTDKDLSPIKRAIIFGINLIGFTIEGFCLKAGWLVEDLCRIVSDLLHGDWETAWEDAKTLVHDAQINVVQEAWKMATGVTDNMMDGKESTQDLGQAFKDLLIDVRNEVPNIVDEVDNVTEATDGLTESGEELARTYDDPVANALAKFGAALDEAFAQDKRTLVEKIVDKFKDFLDILLQIGRIAGSGPAGWMSAIIGGTIGGHGIFGGDLLRSAPVPALATGGVIPPNREFLAVLGDQKQGTNVEAPLETIVDAFRRVMGEGNGQPIILQLDRRELGRAVVDVYGQETQRVGIQLGGA